MGLVAVLVVLTVVSGAVSLSWSWRDGAGVARGVTVEMGQLWVWRDELAVDPVMGPRATRLGGYGLDWWFEDWGYAINGRSARLVAVPVWWAVVVVGVATMFAWGWPLMLLPSRRRAARRAQGLCGRCGYDLRGVDGVCPECGEC